MSVQAHIHIDGSLGGAPENAPPDKYKALRRTQFYDAKIDVERGKTGKLFTDTFTSGGDPIIFTNYDFTLRVTEAELQALVSLLHQDVYFVDNVHPDDGEDHTDYVRTMYFSTLKVMKHTSPALTYYIVAISLLDNDTV